MSDERKTLDQRNQMTDIERLRHSAAHVLATAILRIWPHAQFAYGPPVETGFYYDVQLDHRITPEDFPRIEEEMKKEIKANNVFEKMVVEREQAIADAQSGRLGGLSERPGGESVFKLDLIQSIPDGEPISYFKNGDFIDLCAGPHVMRTGNIGAFRLTHVASAYYKGDEKNPQLQRIYGTAFKNKTQLEYFTMLEEAKKRDHRKLGREMELFHFDDDVGPGLPLWLPNGTVLIEELEQLAKETEFAAGYDRVRTPHLARENMYLTSGHLPYYAESMFPPMEFDEHKEERERRTHRWEGLATQLTNAYEWFLTEELPKVVLDRKPGFDAGILGKLYEKTGCPHMDKVEGGYYVMGLLDQFGDIPSEWDTMLPHDPPPERIQRFAAEAKEAFEHLCKLPRKDSYYLKAMNCPHHHKIFGAVQRSYRDLPLRLAEYGTCYRYEQSGELMGLMRVRSMQMNDAHIYCTEEQFEAEFRAVNEMYLKYFRIFGFEKYQMRFSTHDPEKLGQKFVDEPKLWKKTEDMVRNVLIKSGINYVEVANEAAFYGPKIDVQVWSAIGKEFTIATNQVDFAVPRKFELQYRTRENTFDTPLCIHRAPLGTHERFIGFLIEHYAGNFPLWLAPEQVRVITITDEEPLIAYARGIVDELRAAGVRAKLDAASEPMKAKVANAENAKVHTMLVIGQRDLDAGNVSIRLHGKGHVGAKAKGEAVAELLLAIKERRA